MNSTTNLLPDTHHVNAGDLIIAYHQFGPENGRPIILLHGFPYDPNCYFDTARMLAEHGFRCIVPYLRGFGPTRFANILAPRTGEQAALGADLFNLMDALSIPRATLAGFDWGGRAACIVAALWPERVAGLVSCGLGYNIQDIEAASSPSTPQEDSRFWYMYYQQTTRGQKALTDNRDAFCSFLWSSWSPTWSFERSTFRKTALAFENPDFVNIVIHSYSHRFGEIEGNPQYDSIQQRLARKPKINVPTVVIQGLDDGVDPPSPIDNDRRYFGDAYKRQLFPNVGHNPPQEAPTQFAHAVLSLLTGQA